MGGHINFSGGHDQKNNLHFFHFPSSKH